MGEKPVDRPKTFSAVVRSETKVFVLVVTAQELSLEISSASEEERQRLVHMLDGIYAGGAVPIFLVSQVGKFGGLLVTGVKQGDEVIFHVAAARPSAKGHDDHGHPRPGH